jgi:hypothetical protein
VVAAFSSTQSNLWCEIETREEEGESESRSKFSGAKKILCAADHSERAWG